jgi:UDP-3-O-[3-hydroxymyristoyl] glucosamine N-acyltransferase
MRLSDLDGELFQLSIIRDGEFSTLGSFTRNKTHQLVFVDDKKYIQHLSHFPRFSCVITREDLIPEIPDSLGVAVSKNPMISFYQIHNHLYKNTEFYKKHFNTKISGSATVHPSAYIAKTDVIIGDGCEVLPHSVILEGSTLEKNVSVGPGCVIGCDGLRCVPAGGAFFRVSHAGGVLIHDNVEIQANSVVAKAVYGDNTEICENTKIGILVNIAHNVYIGKRCLIIDSAMISGSVRIGDDVWVGPGAVIADQIQVADKAFITLGSVVTRDVMPGQQVTGNFAIDHKKYLDFIRTIR